MAGGLNSKLHVYTATDLEIARPRLNCARACDGTRSIEQESLVRACARVRSCMAVHACRTRTARERVIPCV